MSDHEEIWDALKEHSKAKFDNDRALFLAQAVAQDDGGWVKHTDYHWSRMLDGQHLNYWPSRKKFQYRGKVRRGNVYDLIRKHTPKEV